MDRGDASPANPLGYLLTNSPGSEDGLAVLRALSPRARHQPSRIRGEPLAWAASDVSYPVTMSNVIQMTDFRLDALRDRGSGPRPEAHWRPVSVGLIHRQPADISEYERRLGPRIFFDQPVNIDHRSPPRRSPSHAQRRPAAVPARQALSARRRSSGKIHEPSAERRFARAMTRCLHQGSFGPQACRRGARPHAGQPASPAES